MIISSIKTFYIQIIRPVDMDIIAKFPISGERGKIFDRNGKKMAYDITVSDVVLKKCDTKSSYEIASFISENFNLNTDSILLRIKKAGKGSLELVSNVNQNKILQLREGLDQFAEIEVENSEIGRYYPHKTLASTIIGKASDDVGRWGIEQDLNELLNGKVDSLSHFILNNGKKIPAFELDDYSNLHGNDIYLTIDLDYQRILSEELYKKLEATNSEYANGIIIDPFSGEILAMSTIPAVDLNEPLKDLESTRNRTVNHSEEPGSTIKTFSILAGLDSEIIDLSDKIFCEANQDKIGKKNIYKFPELNNRPIEDHEGRDTISVAEVLAYSSNIGTVKIALKIGKDQIYNTLRRFGFGQSFEIDFAMNDQNQGMLKPSSIWNKYSWSSIAIGQEMQSNNLHLAMAYSAIANGGYLLKPKLVKSVTNHEIDSDPEIIRKVAEESTIIDIVKALKLVVKSGTASQSPVDFCYYGKTGTAQISFPTEKFTDSNGNLKWDEDEIFVDENNNGVWNKGGYYESKYMPSFAGVFPCDYPQLVCVISFYNPDVTINTNNKWASLTAVPVVQEIFKRLKLKDKEIVL